MKITKSWLSRNSACAEGVSWFAARELSDAGETVDALLADGKTAWADWLIVRVLKRRQLIEYAVFAAEQVIGIFEKKYPNDKRPRLAIEAAKAVLNGNSKSAGAAAFAAGDAARSAWDAAAEAAGDAVAAAAGAAAFAAGAAAWSAGDAA